MLKKYLEIILFKLLCLMPLICLVVFHSLLFPYITGKNFIFRILVELIGAIWLILAFIEPRYRPKISLITLSYLLFLIILGTADWIGENPTLSFWSNYSRMEGWITHAHLFLFFLVATSFIKNKSQWLRFFLISFLVSGLIAIYAFAQTQDLVEVVNKVRVDGTLGNAAYLSIYLALHIFIGFFLILNETRMYRYLIYSIICGVNLFVLFLTQTRSAFLGFGCGLVFLVIYLLVTKVNRFSAKRLLRAIAICLVLGGVSISCFLLSAPLTSEVGSRLVTNTVGGQSVQVRLMIWKAAWLSIKERPWLGWGQENFNYAAAFYPPGMWNEPWPDRAHNTFLDWLLAAGVFGCAAYLLMYLATAQTLWRTESQFTRQEKVVITTLFICFFVNNLFIFDQIVSYIIFFSLLAFIDQQRHIHSVIVPLNRKISNYTLAAFMVVVLGITGVAMYEINYKNWMANLELRKSLNPNDMIKINLNGQPEFAIKSVLNESLFGHSEVRDHLVVTALTLVEQNIDEQLKNKIFQLAQSELDKEITSHPNNPYLRVLMGRLLGAFGQLEKADRLFFQAEALAPNNQDILVAHAENYLRAMQLKKVSELDFKIYHLENPPSEKAQMFYAVGLIYTDRFDEARVVIENLKNAHSSHVYDAHLINALMNSHKLSEAKELIELKTNAEKSP